MKYRAWKSCRRDRCRVCSLRTTSATTRPLQNSVWCCLGAIRRSFCVVSWRRRNMNPLVHTRDQGTIETVNFTRRTCSEEGEGRPIGRKGYWHRFLEFTRYDLHRWPGEGQNCHKALLFRIIGPIRRWIAENMAPFSVEKMLFHHENAPAHIFVAATAKLVELGNELLACPPYSPDLAPCDFFLFLNLKKSLAGQKLQLNEKVIPAKEAYFADLQRTCFLDRLRKLEHRWVKCIELKGDCVEK